MDKIEKIRQEIERRIKLCNAAPTCSVRAEVNKQLLSFLDTLSEEPDKSLEEAAEEFTEQEWDGLHDAGGNALFSEDYIQYAFKAGAEWQKEQIDKLNEM